MADVFLWVLISVAFAAASAVAVYLIARSQMQVTIAKEQAALAEARGALEVQRQLLAEAIKNAEDTGRRRAMEEFLGDIRIEQRHYTRERKLLFMHRRSLVLEERIFFRNIPLSSWIEREVTIEEGADIEQMARSLAIFDLGAIAGPQTVRRKLTG